MERLFPITLIALSIIVGASSTRAGGNDRNEIMKLTAQEEQAIDSGNLKSLLSFYLPTEELVVFDDDVPFQYVGIDAWRKGWSDMTGVDHMSFKWLRQPQIILAGDVAVQFGIAHWTTVYKGGWTFEYDYRVTQCWKRTNRTWRIFHAHYSVPMDPATGKVVLQLADQGR